MGGGEKFSAGGFPRGIFPCGGKFPVSELVRGNYTLQEFVKILLQNYFYMSCLLFSLSILRAERLRIIIRDDCSSGLNFFGEGVFPWRWGQIFWHYLKNNQK